MKFLTKQFLLVVMVILVVAAGVSTWYAASTTNTRLKDSLLGRVSSMSAFIDPNLVRALSGSEADLERAEYRDLKESLEAAVKLNRDVRFVYLMGRDEEGAFFLADSTHEDSEDYSAPGDPYPEATAELLASFDNPSDFVEGPSTDSFGTWLSGLSPVYDEDGRVLAVLGMDITYTSYQWELIKSAIIPLGLFVFLLSLDLFGLYVQRKEQAATDLKVELVSIASHDLRSPLTGIEWAAKSIAENPTDTKNAGEMGAAVAATTAELRNTVNTVLQLAIEGRGIDTGLNKEWINLRKLLTESADVFYLPAQSRQTSIVISDTVAEEIDVKVDRDKFRHALANLINNAVKYTRPNTQITISYKQEKECHIIKVSDEGMGIPKADQEKVMSGYHRAANAAKSGIEGTGLGIILTRRIIEAHGGSLSFESTENVGTSFYIHLPMGEKS
jgi:signal transduction histidine kinase